MWKYTFLQRYGGSCTAEEIRISQNHLGCTVLCWYCPIFFHMKSPSVSVPLILPVPQAVWSSLTSKFGWYFMVSHCISSLCSGISFRKCRSISRAKKVACTFLKRLKKLFLWRLGTVLILVWTNYSALILGPWYASVFDQKELAWRPAQERFKVKCFDLNHSAPIHERRWERSSLV